MDQLGDHDWSDLPSTANYCKYCQRKAEGPMALSDKDGDSTAAEVDSANDTASEAEALTL